MGKKKLSEEDEELVDENVYEVEYVYGIRWHRDKETNFRGLQYRVSRALLSIPNLSS